MSSVNLNKIIRLLKEFCQKDKTKLEIILVGGIALEYYGMKERATLDIDAEVKGDLEGLFNFFKSKHIPADLGENISNWSVISLSPKYRKRAFLIEKDDLLMVKVLHPIDFVMAKLRRFTEEDINDALFVAKKFNLSPYDIQKEIKEIIRISPKDTSIFLFKKNLMIFLEKMKGGEKIQVR